MSRPNDSPNDARSPDGGYPADNDLFQMTDDGCPLVPDPTRWADPQWRDEKTDDARRREFEAMADRLSARVRDASIGPRTEVRLVYRYADRQGHGFSRRVSVTPREYDAEVNRDAIIGTVQELVRAAPTGWSRSEESGQEERVAGFELEIRTAR